VLACDSGVARDIREWANESRRQMDVSERVRRNARARDVRPPEGRAQAQPLPIQRRPYRPDSRERGSEDSPALAAAMHGKEKAERLHQPAHLARKTPDQLRVSATASYLVGQALANRPDDCRPCARLSVRLLPHEAVPLFAASAYPYG